LRFGFNQREVVEAVGIVDGGLRQAFDRSVAFLETAGWMKGHKPLRRTNSRRFALVPFDDGRSHAG